MYREQEGQHNFYADVNTLVAFLNYYKLKRKHDVLLEDQDVVVDFLNRFRLLGDNEEAIKQFFNDDLTRFFECNPYYHIESNGCGLLLFGKERLASTKEIKAHFDFGKRLKDDINSN